MSDETLDKLGTYFVHFDILKRYGLTFERFTQLVSNGQWGEVVEESVSVLELQRKSLYRKVLRV